MFKLDIDKLHSIFLNKGIDIRNGNSVAVCYQAIGFIYNENIQNINIFFKGHLHTENFSNLLCEILNYEEIHYKINYFDNYLEIVQIDALFKDKLGDWNNKYKIKRINFLIINSNIYNNLDGRAENDIMLFDFGGCATSVNFTGKIILAFWNNKSPGTKDSIEYARSVNKNVIIVNY